MLSKRLKLFEERVECHLFIINDNNNNEWKMFLFLWKYTGQKLSHSVVIWPRSQSSENVFVIAAVMVSKSAKL